MSGNELVLMISLLASLFLAWRGLKSQRLNLSTQMQMAAAWVLIIAALTAAVTLFSP